MVHCSVIGFQHAPLKSPSNSYWASFECDNQMIAFDILSLKKNSLINCPKRYQQQPILSLNATCNISRSKSPCCCQRTFVHGEKLCTADLLCRQFLYCPLHMQSSIGDLTSSFSATKSSSSSSLSSPPFPPSC
jgi:hypothetical protein